MTMNDMARTVTGALALLLTARGPAQAQAQGASARDSAERAPGPWQLGVGVRESAFADEGFDPFSTDDGFVQVSISGLRAFPSAGPLTPALGLTWERGSALALARGGDGKLVLSRFAVAAEERLALHRRLWLSARVSGGLLLGTVSLRDGSAPTLLATTFTRPTVDGSLGLTALVGFLGRAALLATAEGGYGWSPRQTLDLEPELAEADRPKGGATSLGTFAARGPFFRLSLALAF
jgi:stage V sporulation protein SpoVS